MEKIAMNDIQPGDKIRVEVKDFEYDALEYIASHIGHSPFSFMESTYYLVERPYVPKYGDVIGKPSSDVSRAVYIPSHKNDIAPWLSSVSYNNPDNWETNEWAMSKLEEGWELIEKPEDV